MEKNFKISQQVSREHLDEFKNKRIIRILEGQEENPGEGATIKATIAEKFSELKSGCTQIQEPKGN